MHRVLRCGLAGFCGQGDAAYRIGEQSAGRGADLFALNPLSAGKQRKSERPLRIAERQQLRPGHRCFCIPSFTLQGVDDLIDDKVGLRVVGVIVQKRTHLQVRLVGITQADQRSNQQHQGQLPLRRLRKGEVLYQGGVGRLVLLPENAQLAQSQQLLRIRGECGRVR